jgi:hypothetical protein
MTNQLTHADLYEALKQADPQAFNSGGALGTKRWVLSSATIREIAALQGDIVPREEFLPNGYLLGIPYRVDDAAEGLTFEDDPT